MIKFEYNMRSYNIIYAIKIKICDIIIKILIYYIYFRLLVKKKFIYIYIYKKW